MIFRKNTNTFKKFTAFFTVFILLAGIIFSQKVFALNGKSNNPLDNMGYRIVSNTEICAWLDKPVGVVNIDQFELFKGSSSATGIPVTILSTSNSVDSTYATVNNTTYSGQSGGGGFTITVDPADAFIPGQTYTLVINGSFTANNGHSIWNFNGNKDYEFNFTMPDSITTANPTLNKRVKLNCQEAYTTSANVKPLVSSWLTSPGGNVNVPLERNIWFSFNIPVTGIVTDPITNNEVTLSTALNGTINNNNTANSGGSGTNLNIIAQNVKVYKKVGDSWVQVTYNPLTSGGTNTQKDLSGNSIEDKNELGSPVISDDNTCITIPMSAGGSAISYNFDCNTEYKVALPKLKFINGQTMDAQEFTFTTAPALPTIDMAKIMISAVADSSTPGNIKISWATQGTGSSLPFTQIGSNAYTSIPAAVAPTGYNIYYSTDKYWNFKLLNTEGSISPVLPIPSNTTYSFNPIAKELDPNITYYFRVSSVNNINPVDQLDKSATPSVLSSGFNEGGMSLDFSIVPAEATATAAVVKAEGSKVQADYDAAKALVDELADGAVKTDLTSRLAAVKTAIDTAGAEATATAAVVKAEGSKVQADYDAAKALVDGLADGTVKTDLASRLAVVKTVIDSAGAEATATAAVVKAEGSKVQADYDAAKALVDGLADGTVKTDLASRLAAVKTAIDSAGVEATATAAVVKAEGSKVQADYDAAKALVDGLADGTVKTDLTSRLAAVKTAIDASVTPGIVNVTGLNLDKTNATVQVNKNITLIATVLPDNATNKNVTWSSSNPDVATVDNTGKITGVKEGKATITATTKDGNISKQCEVTVTIDECFIATAAYGSKYQSSVVLLRHFRDDYLLTNTLGAEFVKFYYKNSPPIANFIAHNEVLKATVRVLLTPFVGTVYGLYHPIVGCMAFVLICMLGLVKRRYMPHRKQLGRYYRF